MKMSIARCCFIVLALVLLHGSAFAATIVLKNGATIRGKLIHRTDAELTLEDRVTKQLRLIKSDQVKTITLDPGEEKAGLSADASVLLVSLRPTIGLMPGIAYPFGKVGKNLALGYGAMLYSDLQIPMSTQIFKIRLGLGVGFFYHPTKSTDYSPQLMIIPVVAHAKFQFITSVGLRPYIKIGGGITPVLASGGSSMDPTFTGGLGLGYVNEKLPYLEFFIEAGAMMLFEKQRGDFITANLGVAYIFGTR
ncbi:MAG: hypothetical protein JW838_07125 [Spirochaetes bacterium]|nr:hypothetical protein [Spirochaetota bacterium]